MPNLTGSDGEIGYGDGGRDWIAGAPLAVLVHGAGGDRSSWPLQARALARAGWNVAAVDLPGHGSTAALRESPGPSIEELATWLDRAIDAVPTDFRSKLAVVGHSMGACIAVTLAATSSTRPDRLALLGAGAAMPVNDTLLSDALHHRDRAASFVAAFGHGAPHHFGSAEIPGIWALGATRAQIERTAPEVLHGDFTACNEWDSTDLLSEIDCPTLVIVGGKDRMTPPRAGLALAEQIAGARVETLAQAGHMMMLESPTEVTRLLLEHLNRGE